MKNGCPLEGLKMIKVTNHQQYQIPISKPFQQLLQYFALVSILRQMDRYLHAFALPVDHLETVEVAEMSNLTLHHKNDKIVFSYGKT